MTYGFVFNVKVKMKNIKQQDGYMLTLFKSDVMQKGILV